MVTSISWTYITEYKAFSRQKRKEIVNFHELKVMTKITLRGVQRIITVNFHQAVKIITLKYKYLLQVNNNHVGFISYIRMCSSFQTFLHFIMLWHWGGLDDPGETALPGLASRLAGRADGFPVSTPLIYRPTSSEPILWTTPSLSGFYTTEAILPRPDHLSARRRSARDHPIAQSPPGYSNSPS